VAGLCMDVCGSWQACGSCGKIKLCCNCKWEQYK
jgi:hypothetical protein